MATLRTHLTINRPADQVWAVVSDAGAISTWFPTWTQAALRGERLIPGLPTMMQRPGTPPGRGHQRPIPVTAPDQQRDVHHPAACAVRAAGHTHPSQRGVFGTPTPVLGASHVAVTKLDAVPASDQGRPPERVRQLTVTQPVLRGGRRVTTAGCG